MPPFSAVLNMPDLTSLAVASAHHGFHKNKAGEKLAESEEDLLEHRTDGTDAFDTLFIGCEKFPQSEYAGGMVDVGGVV